MIRYRETLSMIRNKIIFFLSFLFVLSFSFILIAGDFQPGTPSSSYNFNYNSRTNEPIKKIPQENYAQNSEVVKILVQGNSRLESSVIIRDSKIESLATDEKSLSVAIKNLYKTGYYENVQIYKTNNVVYINVKENPIIDLISIEGNSEIKDEIILQEIESKTRSVFSTDKIKSDVKKIQTLYKRQGFFSTFIEPKFIKLSSNRVNLVFEVLEGKEARIKKINFLNNKVFSDSTLNDVISSTEYRWYQFWGTNDKFDKDRINFDKDLLKKYYFDNGYIDFQISSVNSSLIDNRKNFVVNFTVYEGKRYSVSNIDFKSSIRNLNRIDLKDLLELHSGDWFSSEEIDKSIKNINDKTSELGFAFVDVIPRVKKIGEDKVDVLFDIVQGPKIYIDRIQISGNLKTEDEVVRRELELVEGDSFNSLKIRQSEKNLRSIGLFDNVDIKYEELGGTNKSNLDVEVTERSTGEFSVGGGYSSLDGAMANIAIKESNLFGQAKELSLDLGISTRRSSIDLKYTDPHFMDRDIAAGIDIFNVRRNNKSYSGYKHNILGFKLRSGYEIIDDLRHFSSYSLKRDKIHDIDNATSIYIQEQEGKRTTSIIGQAIQYDKLNDRINPTDGYRIRFDFDFYGLVGDAEHINAELKLSNFYRIDDQLILANFIEGGFIASIKDVKINDRFFLDGDRMRGFKNLGIGPRDSSTSDALGGEIYYISRNELNFPLGLPDELGVMGLIFADIGTLYNTASSGSNINDESTIRSSAGFGITWLSPFGPVKFYFSKALLKENYDKKEIFRFSFGTTY